MIRDAYQEFFDFMSEAHDLTLTQSEMDDIANQAKVLDRKVSLENWLRDKLDENERMHDYAVATDTVRRWIEDYNSKYGGEE